MRAMYCVLCVEGFRGFVEIDSFLSPKDSIGIDLG